MVVSAAVSDELRSARKKRVDGEHAVVLDAAHAHWLIASFCTIFEKSCDAELLARECSPPVTLADLNRIAEQVGLSARQQGFVPNTLESAHTPVALAVSAEGETAPSAHWVILLQLDETRALVAALKDQTPRIVPREELAARATGVAIRFAPKVENAKDPDAAAQRNREFGFRWFVPELLKHKGIWREVLIASLVLQLMALAFPLFTQTIIDKVIVHRTESTLIALAAGMGVFVLFTAALTWVRQYLVLHTGNRVDAVLGSHVFEHLFRLPPLYFQHRPTGVIAARMQGIETIREFVSSAAVMLMLDVPFLFIFVAVMFWYSASLTWIVLGILCLIVAASLRSKRANPAGARAWCFGPSLFCSAC